MIKNKHHLYWVLQTTLFLLVSSFMGSANATLWPVDDVLSGSDDGYGYSSFHDASTGNVMSGPSLGNITGTGSLGTFDDVTGFLDITVNSNGGSTRPSKYRSFSFVF